MPRNLPTESSTSTMWRYTARNLTDGLTQELDNFVPRTCFPILVQDVRDNHFVLIFLGYAPTSCIRPVAC